jgi:hypothetical protein
MEMLREFPQPMLKLQFEMLPQTRPIGACAL